MNADEKTCSRCAEIIKRDAVICRYCGSEFSAFEIAADRRKAANISWNRALGFVGVVALILLAIKCSPETSKAPVAAETTKPAPLAAPAPVLTEAQKAALTERNAARIATLLAQAKALPKSDVYKNYGIYTELLELDPGNAEYTRQKSKFTELVSEQDVFLKRPQAALEVTKFSWSKGGFGTVQLVDMTVTNKASFPIKDFTVICTHYGPSGSMITSSRPRVIYEIVPANGSRRVREINMGFIDALATSADCEITSAMRG